MSAPVRSCAIACEILKAARGRWLTREAMALEVGCAKNTVSAWIEEFRRQGLMVTRQAPEKHGRRGCSPAEFTLAEDWGGLEAARIAPPQCGRSVSLVSVGIRT